MSIAFVQKAENANFNYSGTGATVTFGSNTTAGNMILLAIANYFASGTPATPSVSDNKGNSYSLASFEGGGSGNPRWLGLFYVPNLAGGASHTITVTPTGLSTVSISALEYSGANAGTPFAAATGNTGTSGTPSAGSLTTASGNLYIGLETDTGSTSQSAGSGYTLRSDLASGTSQAQLVVEELISSGASSNPSFTVSSPFPTWAALGATFTVTPNSGGAGGSILLAAMRRPETQRLWLPRRRRFPSGPRSVSLGMFP